MQYRCAKNHRRLVNNVENFLSLTEACKAYKKCINKQFNEYKKTFINKLRSLKNADPKAYWKLLNKVNGSNASIIQKVSLESFAKHFKKVKHGSY